VSMGVSYWKIGARSKGLELTQAGADLVEAEVSSGLMDKEALAVPYGNLATMYKGIGNEDQSAHYADLTRDAKSRKSDTTVGIAGNSDRKVRISRRQQSRPSGESAKVR